MFLPPPCFFEDKLENTVPLSNFRKQGYFRKHCILYVEVDREAQARSKTINFGERAKVDYRTT